METWLIVLIIIVIALILIGVGVLCFFKRDSIKEKFKSRGGWTDDEVYEEIKRVLTESCRKSTNVLVKVRNDAYNVRFRGEFDILVIADGYANCRRKMKDLYENIGRDPNYSYYFCMKRYNEWVIIRLFEDD